MATARDELLNKIVDEVAHRGLGDRSLRDLAVAVGTSHRMLNYHFGSRDGLVTAIVGEVEARERAFVRDLAGTVNTPAELVQTLWRQLISPEVLPFVSLFYEVVALTSRGPGKDFTLAWLTDAGPIADKLGATVGPGEARMSVAVVRGLLIDVLTTGEVDPATRALDAFVSRLD